jgi:outer membrane lipoprotein SlyB
MGKSKERIFVHHHVHQTRGGNIFKKAGNAFKSLGNKIKDTAVNTWHAAEPVVKKVAKATAPLLSTAGAALGGMAGTMVEPGVGSALGSAAGRQAGKALASKIDAWGLHKPRRRASVGCSVGTGRGRKRSCY